MQVAELPHQALEVFPSHLPLGCWNGDQVLQLLEFELWEGDCTCLHVNDLPEDLLGTRPSPLYCQELLVTH